MSQIERAFLGVVVGALPGVLAGTFFVPVGNFALAAAIVLAAMVLCAVLSVFRVRPFPWLESKMR